MRLADTYTWINPSRIAVLTDDHIKMLMQRYPSSLNERMVKYIIESFSTFPQADLIVEWVMKSVSLGAGSYPSDKRPFEILAEFYLEHRKTDRFKKKVAELGEEKRRVYNPKNILDFTLFEMAELKFLFDEPDVDPRVNKLSGKLPDGARLFFNNKRYQIVEVATAQAACTLALGTKWCTSQQAAAQAYLDDNLLYVIYKSGKKMAQFHFSFDDISSIHLKDLRDNEITPGPEVCEVLWESGLLKKMLDSWERKGSELIDYGRLMSEWLRYPEGKIEQYISNKPALSTAYAINVLKGRFPAGEKAIASYAELSHIYAHDVLDGRFPLGEPAIIKNKYYSYLYSSFLDKEHHDQWEEFFEQWAELLL